MTRNTKFTHVAALRPARKALAEPANTIRDCRSPEFDRLAHLVGGEILRNRFGEHLSIRRWYSAPEMCAPDAISLSLLLPQGARDTQVMLKLAADTEQWLFLDTETTGICGGTGTYAFMVGIAWWDAGGLQVEQFFMRDLNEEHSLLLELSGRMARRPVLVTFNGKSFDWPLLETRYRMTRAIPSFTPKLHLDLLHPARQLWRPRLGSVRLKELERHVLEAEGGSLGWSRHDDIDSSLIPQMYFEYLRGGPAEPIAGIFRHNQMDLRGLAALAGKIFSLLNSGNEIATAALHGALDPLDMYGLSRLLHRCGKQARARGCYESALQGGLPRPIERLAQRELAQLAKRERDYTRAILLWEELRQASVATDRQRNDAAVAPDEARKAFEAAIEAAEQLAIYYEHHAKQPQRAAELTRNAISKLRGAEQGPGINTPRSRKLEDRLGRRLARLERRRVTPISPELLPAGSTSPA